LSSSFFAGETQKFDYSLASSVSTVDYSYSFSPLNSVVTVKIPPFQVKRPDTGDDVVHRLKICPYRDSNPEVADNVCQIYEECKVSEHISSLSLQGTTTASIERLLPGKYYIHTTADIRHKGKVVKFVAYPVEIVTIQKSVVSKLGDMIWTIFIIILALAIAGFACFKCAGKFKSITEDRGFELPTFGKKREYGMLGDDL